MAALTLGLGACSPSGSDGDVPGPTGDPDDIDTDDSADPPDSGDSAEPGDPWIRVGTYIACAGRADVPMQCWGGFRGDTTNPAWIDSAPRVAAASAAALNGRTFHVVDISGQRHSWPPSSDSGSLGLPTTSLRGVDAYLHELCVVGMDHAFACAGHLFRGSGLEDVQAGSIHLNANGGCLVDVDGIARCVGPGLTSLDGLPVRSLDLAGPGGCLVSPSGVPSCTPGLAVPPAHAFSRLAVADAGGCGITTTDGRVVCWGVGELETEAPSSLGWVDADIGLGVACAIDADASIACWGDSVGRIVERAPPSLGP